MNNSILFIGIAFIGYLIFTKLSNRGGKNRISQEKAKEMMNGDVYILDVRERSEYVNGHIKNAKNTPLGNVENKVNKLVKDRNATLLVYCQSGARSSSATQKLVAAGYKNVYNFGGIASWKYGTVR
jgi:phage shock protein E